MNKLRPEYLDTISAFKWKVLNKLNLVGQKADG